MSEEGKKAALAIAEQIRVMREALERIAQLDPHTDSEEGFNEWGEADCFTQAQKIASEALAKAGPR